MHVFVRAFVCVSVCERIFMMLATARVYDACWPTHTHTHTNTHTPYLAAPLPPRLFAFATKPPATLPLYLFGDLNALVNVTLLFQGLCHVPCHVPLCHVPLCTRVVVAFGAFCPLSLAVETVGEQERERERGREEGREGGRERKK